MVRPVTKVMLLANVKGVSVQIHFLGIYISVFYITLSRNYSISDLSKSSPFRVSITRAQGNKGVPPNGALLHRTVFRASCRNSRAINREE